MNRFGPTSIDRERLSALLAASIPTDQPVASLYLRTDGTSRAERELVLRDLIGRGTDAIGRDQTLAGEQRERAVAALERVRAAALGAIGAGIAGTFVAFAWNDRLESFVVPTRLGDGIGVGRSPYVAPLASLVERSEHYGVVVADHTHGRILDAFLGSIEQLEDVRDASLKNISWAGWYGRDQLRVNHHRDAVLHAHAQHVADRLFAHHKRRAFGRVILAGLPEIVSKVEGCLHPYLRGLVVARERWEHTLPFEAILKNVARIDVSLETEKERALLASIRDRASGGDRLGTTGTEPTLRALREGRVAIVALPAGVAVPGRECTACGHLFASSSATDACTACLGPTKGVADLIVRAAELASLANTKVVYVAHARSELEALGGMAGVLRFRWPESDDAPRAKAPAAAKNRA